MLNIYHSAAETPATVPANSLILGTFEEVLAKVADNSIDLILIDPPYLSTDLQFDKNGFNLPLLKQHLQRVIKPNGYLVAFGTIPLLAAFCDPFSIRFSGMWLKQQPVMRTATAKKPMSKCEPYAAYCLEGAKISEMVFNKLKIHGKPCYVTQRKNSGYKRDGKDSLSRADAGGWTQDGYICENDGFRWQTDVIEAPNKIGMKHAERTLHPTQKPVAALSTLIRMLTNEGGLVLDCFGGSGSTAEAAIRDGRNFIVCEKEAEYFDRDCAPRIARVWAEIHDNQQLF
jgi:DNA modification methylase